MRKITKSFIALMLTVISVGSVNATRLYADLSAASAEGGNVGNSDGTISGWAASENGGYVFTWHGSWDARIMITDIKSGLAIYDKLVIVAPEFTDAWRVDVEFTYGGTKTIGGAYYSAGTDKVIDLAGVLTTDERSSIKNIRINTASGSGSLRITKLYLEKPMELTWNDNGEAEIDITDLTASGGFSLNDQTGELTYTSGSGTLSVNFPTGGVDLTNLTGFVVSYSGTNVFGGFKFGTSTKTKDFYNNPQGRDDLSTYTTAENVGDPSAVTVWQWWEGSTAGTMTISSIKLKANVMTAMPGDEVTMSSLTNYHWDGSAWQTTGYTPSYRVNESTNAAYFGVDWSGENCQNYSDVTGYRAIRVYSSEGNTPRGMFFNSDTNGQTAFYFTWNSDGYYELLLSSVYASVSNYKLISVRPAQGTTSSITGIYMVINDPTYNYKISGKGSQSSSVTNALADATATSIDATGLTNTSAIELTSANPNCLFVAESGKLSNANNVIVDEACANLELTDNYPFKAPADFTATSATYTTTISTAAEAGTLCLPFAATIPSGVDAYTLEYSSGDAATATDVTGSIPANTPVLLNGSGEATFTGSSVAVSASATNQSGAMTGMFEESTVPTDSYVLQNQTGEGESGLGFYQVGASSITIKPFRAYLTAQGAGSRLRIVYPGDETTAIQGVASKAEADGDIYTLSGVRVSQPKSGIYVKNGKKVVIK